MCRALSMLAGGVVVASNGYHLIVALARYLSARATMNKADAKLVAAHIEYYRS